jgi:hypothetical protein
MKKQSPVGMGFAKGILVGACPDSSLSTDLKKSGTSTGSKKKTQGHG